MRDFSFLKKKQNKIDRFNVDGYHYHRKTVSEAMECYYPFSSCQEARLFLTNQDIEQGNKKRAVDDMRREYIKEKRYNVEERNLGVWVVESFKTVD